MSNIVQLEMKQITVGQVQHLGTTYDIDWMFRTDQDGNVIEREDSAFVFKGDDEIIAFCQPDWEKYGWESINHLMEDATRFITQGIMLRRLEEIEEQHKNPNWLKEMLEDV